MGIKIEDLPTDESQLETDSEIFFEDAEASIGAVMVLAQLDPTEVITRAKNAEDDSPGVVVREARWTEDQQALILKAQEMFDTWAN